MLRTVAVTLPAGRWVEGYEIRLTLAVNASTLPHFTKAASCGETPDAGSVMLARRCVRSRTKLAAYLADIRYSLPFIGICVAYLGGGCLHSPLTLRLQLSRVIGHGVRCSRNRR
jgi:hypothetical protein